MRTGGFRAGAAKKDITPPLGTLINGDFMSHPARTIHDPLFSKALVFENNSSRIAIVVVDICAMDKTFIDAVKADIQSAVGINRENILISSTHTHAAGSVLGLHLAEVDQPYRTALPPMILASVQMACDNLRPAKIGFGSVDVPEHVVCRRYIMKKPFAGENPVSGKLEQVKTNPFGFAHLIDRPASTVDPEVCFLAVQGLDNSWISVLANYSLHYVGDWDNGTITADYFGLFAGELRKQLCAGDEFVAMMSNGTSGEANTWDFLHPGRYPEGKFEKSVLIGCEIAHKVCLALKNFEWETEPDIGAVYAELPMEMRKLSPAELSAARQIVEQSDYHSLKVTEPDAIKRIFAREQVLLGEYPGSIPFPVQALKIGSGIIGALGGEFFAETGFALKEQVQAKNYFTITLANGFVGYVPPEHEFERGGYETWRCRSSFLSEGAEYVIRTRLVALTDALRYHVFPV